MSTKSVEWLLASSAAWAAAFEPVAKGGSAGRVACPVCHRGGAWKREGHKWSAWCPYCTWNIEGKLECLN